MSTDRIIGFTIFAVGVILVGIGHHVSNSPLDQITNAFTGSYTDRTTWYLIVGAAAAVSGALFIQFGRRT